MRQRSFLICLQTTILLFASLVLAAANAQTVKPVVSTRAIRDLLIADHDDAYSMQQLYSLVLDNKGRIYAWDSEDLKIRVFDADGKPLRVLARKGGGPGELSQTGHMSIVHDTLWIVESLSSRITAFPLNGRAVRSFVIASKAGAGSNVIARLADGYWAGVPAKEFAQSGTRLIVEDKTGALVSTILPFSATPKILRFDVVQDNVKRGAVAGRIVMVQPFYPGIGVQMYPNGEGFILAETGASSTLDASIVISSIGLNGVRNWVARTPYRLTPVSNEDYQRTVTNLMAPSVVRGMTLVGSRRMIEDSLLRPKNWPAFTELILGADSSIWLKAGPPSKDGDVYLRFSQTGTLEGTVSLPHDVRVMSVSRTHVWCSRRDDNGSPIIERYRIG